MEPWSLEGWGFGKRLQGPCPLSWVVQRQRPQAPVATVPEPQAILAWLQEAPSSLRAVSEDWGPWAPGRDCEGGLQAAEA